MERDGGRGQCDTPFFVRSAPPSEKELQFSDMNTDFSDMNTDSPDLKTAMTAPAVAKRMLLADLGTVDSPQNGPDAWRRAERFRLPREDHFDESLHPLPPGSLSGRPDS